MKYTHSLPILPSFEGKGLFGFTFGPLQQKDLEIYYIDVELGHDTFMLSKRITRIYYVICGDGYFTIADQRYDVHAGMLVEVPPKLEYSYSGKMKLVGVSKPRWFHGNDTHTKWNSDVVQGDFVGVEDSESWLSQLIRRKIFGKSPVNVYLGLHRRLWRNLPASIKNLGLVRSYGNLVHALARIHGIRGQTPGASFLQNRPQLELIRRLAIQGAETGALRIAVLGCSTGAEAYSIAWAIRSAHPELKLVVHAVDSSRSAVEVGKIGAYSTSRDIVNANAFQPITEKEIKELFDTDEDRLTVKSWIKKEIQWHVSDVAQWEILDKLGSQDIVVANSFLCHMDPPNAERCLRNIARLVRPHGYLIVSGIDLDIRTNVANDLGWRPLKQLLEEIHAADSGRKALWPWNYEGLEPLDKRRQDWERRYAAAFQLVSFDENAQNRGGASTASKNGFRGAR